MTSKVAGWSNACPTRRTGGGGWTGRPPQAVKLIGTAIEAHVAEEHRLIDALSPKERSALESVLSKLLISIEPVMAAAAPGGRRRPMRRSANRPAVGSRRAAQKRDPALAAASAA